MAIRCLLPFLLFSAIASCQKPVKDSHAEREKVSCKIEKLIIKEAKTLNLYASGVGGAERNGMITGIELVFNSDELLSIEKTRDQIVYLTEKAVAIASSHPQAEEFFEVLPVPAELFRIAIIGIRPKPEDREHLHSAGIMEGLISYSVVTPDPRWSNLIDVHEETFEEARAIVRGGKPS